MAVHKKFVHTLARFREAPVYQILGPEGLGIFVWKDGKCYQNINSLKEIDSIINTINFLKGEGYITIEGNQTHIVPNLTEALKPSTADDLRHLDFTQELLDTCYGQVLKIKLSLLGFIEDDYKTARQRKDRRDFWLAIGVAILAAVLTSFFTAYFSYILKVN